MKKDTVRFEWHWSGSTGIPGGVKMHGSTWMGGMKIDYGGCMKKCSMMQ